MNPGFLKATMEHLKYEFLDFLKKEAKIFRAEPELLNAVRKREETHPSVTVIELKRWVPWKSYSETVLEGIKFLILQDEKGIVSVDVIQRRFKRNEEYPFPEECPFPEKWRGGVLRKRTYKGCLKFMVQSLYMLEDSKLRLK